MLTVPTAIATETRANHTFEALLWALSRPGMPRDIASDAEAAIIDALIDRECKVYCADPVLMPLILKTGAFLSDPRAADHAFLGKLIDVNVLKSLRAGSDLYPDDGATVVANAQIGTGQLLRLSGPGVDGSLQINIDGLPQEFWAKRADCLRYPMGFDIFLIDGARVIGLPRSTQIEVL